MMSPGWAVGLTLGAHGPLINSRWLQKLNFWSWDRLHTCSNQLSKQNAHACLEIKISPLLALRGDVSGIYLPLFLMISLLQVRRKVYLCLWQRDIAWIRQHGSQVTDNGHENQEVSQQRLKRLANTVE